MKKTSQQILQTLHDLNKDLVGEDPNTLDIIDGLVQKAISYEVGPRVTCSLAKTILHRCAVEADDELGQFRLLKQFIQILSLVVDTYATYDRTKFHVELHSEAEVLTAEIANPQSAAFIDMLRGIDALGASPQIGSTSLPLVPVLHPRNWGPHKLRPA